MNLPDMKKDEHIALIEKLQHENDELRMQIKAYLIEQMINKADVEVIPDAIPKEEISKVCNRYRNRKIAKGFKWEFEGDPRK